AMQQVHAKDDLLERARRHGANDDRVEWRPAATDLGRQPAEIDDLRAMAKLPRRPQQVADMPAVAAGAECNGQLSGTVSGDLDELIFQGCVTNDCLMDSVRKS